MPHDPAPGDEASIEDRRKFLKSAAKLAIVTPPSMSLLLSTRMNSQAVAASGGSVGRRSEGFSPWKPTGRRAGVFSGWKGPD